MKKIVRNVFFVFLAAGMTLSCAKQETLSYTDLEQASLDTWMATYIQGTTRQPNGMYTKVLRASVDQAANKPKEGDWVEVLFTGWSMPDSLLKLAGNVFVTRDSTVAAICGSTGAYQTHYAAKKCYMSTLAGVMTEAMYQTLLMMKPGEKWAVYAPSPLMYGATGTSEIYNYGYQGSSTLPANVPCYMEIELQRVITDVTADEKSQVEAYAAAHLGKQPQDSTMVDYYLNTYPQDIAADSIGKDSTVNVYYVKRFLDGMVYETNIDSISLRVFGKATTISPLSYRPSINSEIEAFYQAITRMTYNSWAKFVFTSRYGYSYSGLSIPANYGAEIDPYMPLYYEIYVPSWADHKK